MWLVGSSKINNPGFMITNLQKARRPFWPSERAPISVLKALPSSKKPAAIERMSGSSFSCIAPMSVSNAVSLKLSMEKSCL